MRVIGVLDLAGGCAVHARAGARDLYPTVRTIAGLSIAPGDAAALAVAYRDRLGIEELYVADLDAIRGRASQDSVVAALARLGLPLWLDGGIASAGQARRLIDIGAARAVVGLETLPSYDVLTAICDEIGGERVAFSLDLRAGEPIVRRDGIVPADGPAGLAARAAAAGVGALIVIDLARVGTSAGPDLAVIADVRRAAPGIALVAGGGVRGAADLARLADAGCDGVLVATALHEGRLSATEIARARTFYRNATR